MTDTVRDMPESVIVTIKYQSVDADFEIPLQLPMSAWIESLSTTMQKSFAAAGPLGKNWSLCYKGKALYSEYTLGQYGIYDGAILEVQLD